MRRALVLLCVLLVLVTRFEAGEARRRRRSGRRASGGGAHAPSSKRAVVTLLYSDFVDGVRTLGAALRAVRTDAHLVALVAPSVASATRRALRTDGWRVSTSKTMEATRARSNPANAAYAPRLWGVYAKFEIFNMTQYERVLYLDGAWRAPRLLAPRLRPPIYGISRRGRSVGRRLARQLQLLFRWCARWCAQCEPETDVGPTANQP